MSEVVYLRMVVNHEVHNLSNLIKELELNGYAIQQSTSSQPLVFLMIDSSDHVSGKTGLSPTVTISKNGGAFASPAGGVTEIGSGLYKVAANFARAPTGCGDCRGRNGGIRSRVFTQARSNSRSLK